MRSRKLCICLKKDFKISNNKFYLRNKRIAVVLIKIIAHASLIRSAWQGVNSINRDTNRKKSWKSEKGGKALVLFSPPSTHKKNLPVEHAVSSGKLLRVSVTEVVKSSTSLHIVCGEIFLALHQV